jgi:hypothetical protein
VPGAMLGGMLLGKVKGNIPMDRTAVQSFAPQH